MAELADALVSGTSRGYSVWVQVPSSAPRFLAPLSVDKGAFIISDNCVIIILINKNLMRRRFNENL